MTDTVPDDFVSVCRVPADELFIVMRLPETPDNKKSVVIVVVVLDVKVTVAGCVLLLIVPNVLLPLIIN